MNKNIPPLQVWIRNEFILINGKKGTFTYAHLISVRSLQNQCLQFSVLTSDGALITGLPPHSISFTQSSKPIDLQECIMWDNISSNIDVVTFETLRYMECVVKTTSDKLILAEYLFTVDYVGENDLSRNSEHWKQTHVLQGKDGNMYVYPQYRIQFKDAGLCFESKEKLNKYKYNRTIWKVGS